MVYCGVGSDGVNASQIHHEMLGVQKQQCNTRVHVRVLELNNIDMLFVLER